MNLNKAPSLPAIHPYCALLSGVLAVSTGAVFARLADAPPLIIAAYRLGIAVLLLAPLALWKFRKEIGSLSKSEWGFTLLAGFFLALHFAFWISSLAFTSVASSVVLVNTNPLWVALFTPVITAERLRPAAWVSIVMSVTGAVLIGAGDFESGGKALRGDFLALAGGICMAVYLLLGKKLRGRLSLIGYVFVCYAAAAACLWLAVLLLRIPFTGFGSGTWALFGAMAFISQLVGHTSYNWALKWLSTSLVAVSLLGEPIGSTILAYLLLGETPGGVKLGGGVLILAGIYIAAVNEKK